MLSMPTPGALELLPLEPAGGDLRMLRPRSLAVKTILAARRTIRMDAVERPEWRWILVRLFCTTRKSVVSTFPGNRSSSAGKVKSNGNVALPRKAIHVGAQSRLQPPDPGALADAASRKTSEAHEYNPRPKTGSPRARGAPGSSSLSVKPRTTSGFKPRAAIRW